MGVVFHLLTVFGHGLHPVVNPRVILEHARKLHPRMRLRTDFDWLVVLDSAGYNRGGPPLRQSDTGTAEPGAAPEGGRR